MDYRTNNNRSAITSARAATVLAVAICMAPSLTAQMGRFNVSSYNQVWATSNQNGDGTTIYGSSTFSDNSQLGTCGHSAYSTSGYVVTPDGVEYPASGGYMTISPWGAFTVPGTYTEIGQLSFRCSCVGNVGSGGEGNQCFARTHLPSHCGAESPGAAHRITVVARLNFMAVTRIAPVQPGGGSARGDVDRQREMPR